MTVDEIRGRIEHLKGRRASLEETFNRLNVQVHDIDSDRSTLVEVRKLLILASARSREEIKGKIERMVTYALQTVLERDDYRFEIRFEDKRGRIEVEPILHTATSSGNPLDNNGGGVVDIIATTLRLIVKLTLGVPGPIIVDEPAKWIAEAHRPHFMRMLREFGEKTGTQIIMCTHVSEYVAGADKILEVTLANGQSRVRDTGPGAHEDARKRPSENPSRP